MWVLSEFITMFGGAAVTWPLVARAQRPKLPTIGVLLVESLGSEQFGQQLREELRKLGHVDGQSIRFEVRSDQGKATRLPELAAELVQLKVDIIVTWFTPAARAAKEATREIPIVMALAGNPVETGLVESLARPGGNVTGISGVGAELAGKSVEVIVEILPSARRVAALGNAPDPFSKPFLEKIRLGAKAAGITIDWMMISGADELDVVFTTMEKDRPDAVIVQPSLGLKRSADLALKYRIPAISIFREFAEEGGLMSYSSANADIYRRAAAFVGKILKRARPAELPVAVTSGYLHARPGDSSGLHLDPGVFLR